MYNYKKILFRADSSSKIGLGHIKRDLVLAKRLKKEYKNSEIYFACLDLEGNIIDEIPYKTYILENGSIDELIQLIKKNSIDTLVIDHYGISYEDEKKIKENTGVNLIVLDDNYKKHHCDILINHNIHADKKRYLSLVPKNCKIRCGRKYTLIREEFKKEKRKKYKTEKNIKNIFISFGGSDPKNFTLDTIKTVKRLKNIKVIIATTYANPNLKKLIGFAKGKNWIKLYINYKNIAKLIKKSDLAVISPSVLTAEVMFLNKKFIAVKTAKNQTPTCNFLKKNNLPVLERYSHYKLLGFLRKSL